MHWVQALIASGQTLAEARRLVPSMVVCPLTQGFALVPITEQVEKDLGEAAGVTALAARLSVQGSVVYAATYFYGGAGRQEAKVWQGGALTLDLGNEQDNAAAWPNSPISRALRHVGVVAAEGQDEFDALGLGQYRSNERWAQACTQ